MWMYRTAAGSVALKVANLGAASRPICCRPHSAWSSLKTFSAQELRPRRKWALQQRNCRSSSVPRIAFLKELNSFFCSFITAALSLIIPDNRWRASLKLASFSSWWYNSVTSWSSLIVMSTRVLESSVATSVKPQHRGPALVVICWPTYFLWSLDVPSVWMS